MKTFQDYLKENDEESLNGFLQSYGLEDDWKAHKNKPKDIIAPPEEGKGWKLDTKEVMRDVNRIIKNAINTSTKVNRFGIDDISFEINSTEETSTGMKISLEAQGTVHARNSDHIKRQLEKLMQSVKNELDEKGISMQMLYNNIDTNDSIEESNDDEPAVGLVRKIDFRIMCVVIVNTKKHRKES